MVLPSRRASMISSARRRASCCDTAGWRNDRSSSSSVTDFFAVCEVAQDHQATFMAQGFEHGGRLRRLSRHRIEVLFVIEDFGTWQGHSAILFNAPVEIYAISQVAYQ